ncbi:excinuclease ABC subunit B [Salipiger aestuarii]|uniref:Excinuclease ABC subunit B n=1 Tax=Salipiger aestuarii TaxID=568098 RepID=A0A327XN65_9RHOB|nr:hypothetical protein [Salipiger aestuarii]EIE52885.1 hypothetical protein C357_01435 [Citreicella sp. 357]KAA8605487.1 excinuclease ABC subunit B [Salipiger aestuarii]KAA8613023.1 excinuclease ABC subunit B [Salipiger aestuarii]KAB2531391.1 excinuclease ABC subunit B [Salipiger aestuarii]RAK07439.1 hypothetical protein ATI53_11002 [Salipiger aestuarii]
MRHALAIPVLALLMLAACATPREACLTDAAAPWRSAMRESERIAKDLARGYTFETKFERRRVYGTCRTSEGHRYSCWDTQTEPVTRRVPVDRAALTTRLAELQQALPALRAAANTDAAQCRATYPEE